MTNRIRSALVSVLVLLFLLPLLPSCSPRVDPLTPNGFSSLTLDQKGETVTATVTLNARTLSEAEGKRVYLYELTPDQSVLPSDAKPIAEASLASSIRFRFPLSDGERTRLYSTFAVGFEDGSLLAADSFRIENPEVLATNRTKLPWLTSPKGLWDADADLASELGAMHVMYTLPVSSFFDGTDKLSFGGTVYTYSAAVLAQTDRQIKSATDAGLQVSLRIVADRTVSDSAFAAMTDLLASRYSTSEHGTVTAFFLDMNDYPLGDIPSDAGQAKLTERAASYLRLANLALRSRVAAGRVYINYGGTETELKTFFSELGTRLSKSGTVEWGAAIDLMTVSADATESVTDLPELLSQVTSSLRASWIAINGLTVEHGDEAQSAAALAFAYRSAANAKATMIFYTHPADDLYGLRTQNGTQRRIEEVFREIDGTLSEQTTALCLSQYGQSWTDLSVPNATSRTVTGSAASGVSTLEERAFFDFQSGETYGFTGIGSASAPESHMSAVFSAPVLYTWLSPVHSNVAGVRKTLTDASVLDGALTLTVQLLSQAKDAERCTLRLGLVGTAKDGARLTYTSEIEIANGSWQTATFQISNFVSAADLSKTCVLSLTVEPDIENDSPYVLWVRGMNLRNPDRDMDVPLAVFLITGGALLGFAVVFLVYFLAVRRRDREERLHRRRAKR